MSAVYMLPQAPNIRVLKDRAGSVQTDADEIFNRKAHFFDFLTATEQNDYRTNAAAEDLSTPFQSALTQTQGDAALWLPNGTANLNTTNVAATDRIVIQGESKEDTKILSSATSGNVIHLQTGANDPEESFFSNFSIETDGTPDVGLQIDASYVALRNVRVFIKDGSSDYTVAAISTDPTTNTNQLVFFNVEVRSQSNPGGTLGLYIPRGANIGIYGGYYGDFDTCIKLGDGTNQVTNIDLGGGVLIETFDPQNAATAIGLHLDGVDALNISGVRFQADAAGHRMIKVTARWRGGAVKGNSFDGTGVADAAISFAETAENASGVAISGNLFNSVGSASTNPIELTGDAKTITNATQANPVVITSTAHGFSNGDEVTIENVGGMTEINNRKFIVANQTANTFELQGENGLGHTAYTSGGTATKYHDPNLEIGQNHMQGTANRSTVDPTFRDQDATPSVAAGNFFRTANTAPTTITDLDGVDRAQTKTVHINFNDNNTTVDFTGSSLKGNGGVDWNPSTGESMICTQHDQLWFCVVSS